MSKITITRDSLNIKVSSPFSPDLPKQAKNLSGRWDGSSWVFPLEAEPQVKDLYVDIYGEWDNISVDYVNLICISRNDASEHCGSLTLGSRVIARAYGRDSGAKTAEGVIVIEGGFTSGGSVKNWATKSLPGTKFRLLNVPRIKAELLVSNPEWCEKIEIEECKPVIDYESLKMERKKLMDRIDEIDKLIKNY